MSAHKRLGWGTLFGGYLVLTAAALAFLAPVWWCFAASLAPEAEAFGFLWWPKHPNGEHYLRLLVQENFLRLVMNSLFVASSTTLLALFFCALGGFAFAKYVFPGRGMLFAVVLGALMIPFHVLLVPLFRQMHLLGVDDSLWGVILPFSVSAFGVFLVRQAARTVPDDLLDAARLDGCGEFGVFWHVALPLLRPALGALAILVFMRAYQDFLWALVVLRTGERYTVQLGLQKLIGMYQQNWEMLLAGSFVSFVPVLLLFVLLQRDFVAGLTAGGLQG